MESGFCIRHQVFLPGLWTTNDRDDHKLPTVKMRSPLRYLAVFLFSVILSATASPLHQNNKRSTEVSLLSYTYSNNVLAGSITVATRLPKVHHDPSLMV
jgi:hypothetical protein